MDRMIKKAASCPCRLYRPGLIFDKALETADLPQFFAMQSTVTPTAKKIETGSLQFARLKSQAMLKPPLVTRSTAFLARVVLTLLVSFDTLGFVRVTPHCGAGRK